MSTEKSPIYFLINPDIVLREEDPDGALLFNPDTNDVKVLNQTGLFIWKECQQKKSADELVGSLIANFEDVPQDKVSEELASFIDHLEQSGFIGKVS